ncbi:hypothetical protein [Alicyclobacillus fastidiosus]|uniref:Uncharacterized protein n=1 Tax=Alicyclobacillus fastidiosus TaxID=392011 RepID=A0ABV5A9J4_9BACL|nr:hypothetical protein [Alicyclobacillus fastidiosus]WEH10873.1 hypothetical protein PYS47_06555 [Alicyclobacillus fastidiosus]
MNHLNFANHLGFDTWDKLLEASECIAFERDRVWYITQTNTWYKWVVWNTGYDMFYNHETRQDALSSMKWLFDKLHIDLTAWCAPEPFNAVHAEFLGMMNTRLW